jgi:hypothetical protein
VRHQPLFQDNVQYFQAWYDPAIAGQLAGFLSDGKSMSLLSVASYGFRMLLDQDRLTSPNAQQCERIAGLKCVVIHEFD